MNYKRAGLLDLSYQMDQTPKQLEALRHKASIEGPSAQLDCEMDDYQLRLATQSSIRSSFFVEDYLHHGFV